MSTFSGIEETKCLHFQEYFTTVPLYSACVRNVFRSPAESIPYAYGMHSARIRNMSLLRYS